VDYVKAGEKKLLLKSGRVLETKFSRGYYSSFPSFPYVKVSGATE
jgi:hypothetical protein